MVGDKEVLTVLLRKLLDATYRDGVVLDGFPRTPVQVECLKLLVDKISELHDEFANTPLAIHFRRPTIHAMVLFVSESTSITRQLGRGREIAERNRKAAETGIGDADRAARDRSVGRARAAAVSGVQGADVGGADVTAAALSLSLRQRRGSDRGGAGQHPQGAQVSELARAGPAHVRAAARRAAGRGARRARPAGAGQAARQLRAGAHGAPAARSSSWSRRKFMPIITRHALVRARARELVRIRSSTSRWRSRC